MRELELDQEASAPADSDDARREAIAVLCEVFADRAGEEALMRAIVAERMDDRKTARFWVSVYAAIVSASQAMLGRDHFVGARAAHRGSA